MNKYLLEEYIKLSNRHMKDVQHWGIFITEVQVKTTMRHHCTANRMVKIKTNDIIKCWRGCGQSGSLTHSWQECKMVKPFWKNSVVVSFKTQYAMTVRACNVARSCPTLGDSMNCSLPGPSVHGVLWPSNCIPRHESQTKDNTFTFIHTHIHTLYTSIHSSFICNTLNTEISLEVLQWVSG